MKNLRLFLIFFSIFILVGIACQFSIGSDPTATPVVKEEVEDTPTKEPVIEEPTPTNPPPTETQPLPTATEPPATSTQEEMETDSENEPPAYFIEEFNGSIDSWTYFLMSGDENKMDLYTLDGYLVFDLQGENQWVYLLYDEYTYPEVRLDVIAENRGMNTNSVSLVCNYSDQEGWYELNVSNGGMYEILVYSEIDGGYYTLATGGSTNLVTGRSENLYTAICQGNQLALYINGVLEREYTDNVYNLSEGQVGVSVSSFDVLPILVYIDAVSIDLP